MKTGKELSSVRNSPTSISFVLGEEVIGVFERPSSLEGLYGLIDSVDTMVREHDVSSMEEYEGHITSTSTSPCDV